MWLSRLIPGRCVHQFVPPLGLAVFGLRPYLLLPSCRMLTIEVLMRQQSEFLASQHILNRMHNIHTSIWLPLFKEPPIVPHGFVHICNVNIFSKVKTKPATGRNRAIIKWFERGNGLWAHGTQCCFYSGPIPDTYDLTSCWTERRLYQEPRNENNKKTKKI